MKKNRYQAFPELIRLWGHVERGGETDIEYRVLFRVKSYVPGYPATWDEPGAGPEFEFEIVGLDSDEPLTAAEHVAALAWTATQHEQMCLRAMEESYDARKDVA